MWQYTEAKHLKGFVGMHDCKQVATDYEHDDDDT